MFRLNKDGFMIYDPFHENLGKDLDKKHKCADCSFCQMCAESRCNLCRNRSKQLCRSKLSLKDQIEFYDKLNKS